MHKTQTHFGFDFQNQTQPYCLAGWAGSGAHGLGYICHPYNRWHEYSLSQGCRACYGGHQDFAYRSQAKCITPFSYVLFIE